MPTVKKHAKQPGDIASLLSYNDLNSVREGGRDLFFGCTSHLFPSSPTLQQQSVRYLKIGQGGLLFVLQFGLQ